MKDTERHEVRRIITINHDLGYVERIAMQVGKYEGVLREETEIYVGFPFRRPKLSVNRSGR